MKKLILILFILFFATLSHAAWTVTVSLDRTFDWDNGQRMHVFKFDCTSDASSSGDLVLTTELKKNTTYGASSAERERKVDELMKSIAGGMLFYVKYEPATTPAGVIPATASTITVDDETTALIFSELVATAATAEGWSGDIDMETMPPITDITVAATTLANEDKAVIWIWILR